MSRRGARNGSRAYLFKESAELVVLTAILAVVSRFIRIPVWVLVGVPLGKIFVSSAMYVLFLRRSFLCTARVGREALIGLTAEAVTPLNPFGQVKINGEIWSAISQNGTTIPSQQKVRVLEAHGNTLHVITLT
ncbi:NfeD family protein [Candidatus Bipolaricaulota bacterium]|nr:NfeD family protein [Candidatus Bipolaricaulota bacterium]